jgi:hypothetical protein
MTTCRTANCSSSPNWPPSTSVGTSGRSGSTALSPRRAACRDRVWRITAVRMLNSIPAFLSCAPGRIRSLELRDPLKAAEVQIGRSRGSGRRTGVAMATFASARKIEPEYSADRRPQGEDGRLLILPAKPPIRSYPARTCRNGPRRRCRNNLSDCAPLRSCTKHRGYSPRQPAPMAGPAP